MKQLLLAALVTLAPLSAWAAAERPEVDPEALIPKKQPDDEIVTDGVDITERLGERAAIDVPLVDHEGKIVRLRDYLGKKPVIVAMVYYRCPTLCGLMLQGLTKVLTELDWKAGQEYEVLTLSVDPNESTELAKEKRRGFLQALGDHGKEGAWPFFTGSVEAIDFLAASLGFKFKYIARERQFAHVAALFVLSPQGTISRYLYGVKFDPKDVKLALFEAADGRVGTSLERVLLRCYQFDPSARKYHLFVRAYYRVWGTLIVLALGTFLGVLWRRELKRKPADADPERNAKANS